MRREITESINSTEMVTNHQVAAVGVDTVLRWTNVIRIADQLLALTAHAEYPLLFADVEVCIHLFCRKNLLTIDVRAEDGSEVKPPQLVILHAYRSSH